MKIVKHGDDVSGCYMDELGLRRYELWLLLTALETQVTKGGKSCVFIMLNPSTADASINDPTVRRCMGFARSWGFDELVVYNLFSLRATDPRKLRQQCIHEENPNIEYVISSLMKFDGDDIVLCAWGQSGPTAETKLLAELLVDKCLEMGRPLYCLTVTLSGHPGHPLYIDGTTQPQPYVIPAGGLK